jgi:hypothetical protein
VICEPGYQTDEHGDRRLDEDGKPMRRASDDPQASGLLISAEF